MANKFFEPGEGRAARVHDLFATVAPRYDLINDLQSLGLHRHWKRLLTQMARVRPGERALDLCSGTGDVAFVLAEQGARVAGLDFSAPMLAVARTRTRRAQAGNRRLGGHRLEPSGAAPEAPAPVKWVCGDAMHVPFADDTFDIVTIAYGLRNLRSFEAGLREMWRVAKPGGRLLVLDFGKPDNPLWRSLYFAYLRRFVPWFGRIFCGDPDTHGYILESLKHYPAQHGVAANMRDLNCRSIRVVTLLGGVMSINYGVKTP
jgi:demethylmenaquinone methyltransferase/2-methoxy-6-polyprenyl-1,4-benzoquinol methylase